MSFLQNFNDDSFDILLQAKDYFRFAVLFVAAWACCSRSRSACWR